MLAILEYLLGINIDVMLIQWHILVLANANHALGNYVRLFAFASERVTSMLHMRLCSVHV